MGSKIRIILGILLIFPLSFSVESASLLRHFRPIRDAGHPAIHNTSTTEATNTIKTNKNVIELNTITNSSLSSSSDKNLKSDAFKDHSIEKNINKIKSTSSDESDEKLTEEDTSKTFNKDDAKQSKDDENDNSEAQETKETHKGTGRSLNINIDKYISPEFHNKNNVYTLPTSPEIEKYVNHDSEEYTEDVTKPVFTSIERKNVEIKFDTGLTTPHNDYFDSKFRLVADGIKQNLDEIDANVKHDKEQEMKTDDDKTKYDVSKLIDNYKNADNETDVSLHVNEFKNLEIKTEENKANKDIESGKKVDYESTYLKTRKFDEKPQAEHSNVSIADNLTINKTNDSEKHESSTFTERIDIKKPTTNQDDSTEMQKISSTTLPTKKPRLQVSLHNNTIETTASESDLKQKTIKFVSQSPGLDPLHDAEKSTYTKPAFENAINISKRGSTKYVESNGSDTTTKFMDYDNKNYTIPPTATAWTLVSLKDLPSSTPSFDSKEQNVQENQLVKVELTAPTKKPETFKTTTELITNSMKPTTNNDQIYTTVPPTMQTTIFEKITTMKTENVDTRRNEAVSSETTEALLTKEDKNNDKTTEIISTTLSDESSTNSPTTTMDDSIAETTEETTENTTNFKTTPSIDITDISTTDSIRTTSAVNSETFNTESETEVTDATTSTSEISYEVQSVETKTETYGTTDKIEKATTENIIESNTVSTTYPPRNISTKTESENELFTTSKTTTRENEKSRYSTQNAEAVHHGTTPLPMTTKSEKLYTNIAVIDHNEDEENSAEDNNDYVDLNNKKDEKNMTDHQEPDSEHNTDDNNNVLKNKSAKSNETVIVITTLKTPKDVPVTPYVDNTSEATSSTELLSHDEDTDDSNTGMIAAIAISSVGGICLVILAGLLLIMRKRQKRVTYGQRCRPVSLDAYSLDNVSVYNSVRRKGGLRASKRSYGNPAFDDPVSISHQMNFQSLAKFAENTEAMSAEFDEIPQVTARANEVPPGCETKNRYANVIPLPETRVFLKASDNDPHSDYINANYVTGPKNTRGYYIACQAPLPSTVDDFWRMIWEQQCRVILMMTNLYENGVEKCADYLPPSEVLDCHRLFGDFQITLKKREVKEKYIISSLQLKNMVSNSWREVTHLWYLGWPERGVPTEANSLIAFLIEGRSHLKAASNNNSSDDKTSESSNVYISGAAGGGGNESGPMIVHCSPGTGRTGTVIACDIAIRDFEMSRSVDIPKIVYRVRRDRASAVQTRDQYAFIYKVISLYATKLTGGALDSI